ncbi:aminopeptidase N [Propioniciclava coleopterorum]|uniref:Aminopeptidase N n=1 Tax=Propioniciclava coleopterorum TaxID=2714937 RepID=A0A6G7Y3G9_9ACTN|nr:aminopeptidase N [Propioniciclava coleopterorum]QIK71171.1 aminopeptidase N [Propioniciclava coleopterorum]
MFRANITRDEANTRSRQLRTASYEALVDLSGRLPDGTPLAQPEATFVSTTTARFSSIACVANANVIADEILSATLDGEAVPAEAFDGEHLTLTLAEGDHELVVTAVMRFSRTGEGLHRFVDPADDRTYLYTQFEVADARRMYVTFEQPDLKATFQLSVIAPQGWTVLSNAPAVEPVASGDDLARWDFPATKRLSTYITALIAGEFHSVTDEYVREDGSVIPLSIHVRTSLAEHLDADRIFETTKRGFAVFEEHFGQPYPFDDYAQVFVPEFNFGAMENAGCITFRDEYIFRSRQTSASYESRDNTILHEMAHMWFGDLVTMVWWDDLWLNESFAEWASHFAQEEIRARFGDRANPWATFTNSRKTWAYRQDQLPSTHPIAADMVDLEAVELNFDGITYAKGASALRQLVAFVGKDDFLAGVRAYFAKHAWGNTQLPDLLDELEVASGRDLSFFSSQWLQTAGVNTLAADWDERDGAFTRFAIRQWASPQWPTLRRHRIAVGLYNLVDGVLTRTDRVETDIDGESTDVPELVGKPRPDLLLLNDDDLTYAKIRLDPRSLATLVGNVHLLDDELARALAWGATWDLTRDGEMSASDYVDLVLRGVGVETDLTAVTALLGQARLAVDYYAPRADRKALAQRFTAGLAQLLKDAAPGSDHQLALTRALALSIGSEPGAAVLKAWLDGEEVPEGLVLDADLRWRLLTELARVGAAGEAEIAAELAGDRTATGAEKAAGARSASRDADAKAAAWRAATAEDTANETHFQIASQFWQLDQDEILAPYTDAYLDVVAEIGAQKGRWATASTTIRQHVLGLLFPRPLADRTFLTKLDAFLADHDLPDSVKRLVLERRDDALRALHNQGA